jgi:hypothetical protein
MELRSRDDRWISDTLALIWYRFWMDEDAGWSTLWIMLLISKAYNRKILRILIDLPAFFESVLSQRGRERLEAIRSGLGPQSTLEDEITTLSLFQQKLFLPGLRIEDGCGDEISAILVWWNANISRKQKRLSEAMLQLEKVREKISADTKILIRLISREFYAIGDELRQSKQHDITLAL